MRACIPTLWSTSLPVFECRFNAIAEACRQMKPDVLVLSSFTQMSGAGGACQEERPAKTLKCLWDGLGWASPLPWFPMACTGPHPNCFPTSLTNHSHSSLAAIIPRLLGLKTKLVVAHCIPMQPTTEFAVSCAGRAC